MKGKHNIYINIYYAHVKRYINIVKKRDTPIREYKESKMIFIDFNSLKDSYKVGIVIDLHPHW